MFEEVQSSFENQSIWKYLDCDGDGEWSHQGLVRGSLDIVRDGSYMPEISKEV